MFVGITLYSEPAVHCLLVKKKKKKKENGVGWGGVVVGERFTKWGRRRTN